MQNPVLAAWLPDVLCMKFIQDRMLVLANILKGLLFAFLKWPIL